MTWSTKLYALVRFRNPLGYLQASKAPLVTLHFVNARVYFILTLFWLVRIIKRRDQILKIQHFVSSLGLLIAFEQLVTGFYHLSTRLNGKILGFLWMVATLGAFRFVFTFIFLLLSNQGYSLVWEITEIRSVLYWLSLDAGSYTTSLFYLVNTCYNSGDGTEVQLFGVKVISVFAALILLNLLWIHLCLSITLSYLVEQGQYYKVKIYKRLRLVIFDLCFEFNCLNNILSSVLQAFIQL